MGVTQNFLSLSYPKMADLTGAGLEGLDRPLVPQDVETPEAPEQTQVESPEETEEQGFDLGGLLKGAADQVVRGTLLPGAQQIGGILEATGAEDLPVSYTHLTLPTILLV